MEKTLPLYLGPSVIGSVVCRRDDRHMTFLAKTYASLSGICRAYVGGRDGKLLIGVLAPCGSAFSAEKVVTRAALSDSGLTFDGITYAYALCSLKKQAPVICDWRKIEHIPDILCRDKAVCALAKSTGALTDSARTPTRLAVPLLTERPFPRPDILCLLTPTEIDGVMYGVLGISKSGLPEKI